MRLIAFLARTLPWERGWRVLDVGCGPGRHPAAFEALGARCVGVDLSATLLRRARQVTRAQLVRADKRWLPVRGATMDLTVNLFTSFGYFESDAEHEAALGEMVRTVRPGGWFVLDFLNATRVRIAVGAGSGPEQGTGGSLIERRLTEGGRFVAKSIALRDGRRFEERVRLFGAGELEAMLVRQGVHLVHRFGDYDGAPLGETAPRVVLAGTRA